MLFSCSSDNKILGQINARSIIEAVYKFFSNVPNLCVSIDESNAFVSSNEVEYNIKRIDQ